MDDLLKFLEQYDPNRKFDPILIIDGAIDRLNKNGYRSRDAMTIFEALNAACVNDEEKKKIRRLLEKFWEVEDLSIEEVLPTCKINSKTKAVNALAAAKEAIQNILNPNADISSEE